MHPATRFRLALLPVLLSLAAGCGGDDGRVVIKGSLVENGKPFILDESKLKLPPGATSLPPGPPPLRVTFIPADGGDQQSAVIDAATGTFTVPGPDGKGIKPGRYKIAVMASLRAGAPEAIGGKPAEKAQVARDATAADAFGGKFTAEKTQIVRDVKAGEEVVIDVAKAKG